ncbi:hypothetical protein SISNIDRAFT_491160 [Sistotremastrum niveocremeum HHB9708]|uniref:Uncharacterized protein n=2 Tax=Sistotremastraceae TaxID=3402574 RepID=A0A164N354_9AGAM|nr:hypothetical protein SISNIDRAFT_491160 [Sistotremastrum niveocremeum HHB9708]KZT35213.1 hypothetical protein SISSUDRAFT_196204 [Sistotremastrum suecicum HHB10207 ss-3]
MSPPEGEYYIYNDRLKQYLCGNNGGCLTADYKAAGTWYFEKGDPDNWGSHAGIRQVRGGDHLYLTFGQQGDYANKPLPNRYCAFDLTNGYAYHEVWPVTPPYDRNPTGNSYFITYKSLDKTNAGTNYEIKLHLIGEAHNALRLTPKEEEADTWRFLPPRRK